MQGMIINILGKILINMMTYKMVSTLIVELLEYAANHTENEVDNKIVATVREALMEKPEKD